jgi:DNA-binding MarR family transcriptional regulator
MAGQEAIKHSLEEEIAASAMVDEEPPLKLEQFLPYQLNIAATLASQAMSRVYTGRYRMGIPEWRVLVTLGEFGWMNGKAICSQTFMHKTKVSRAIATLERRKLVVRRTNRADMRETLVALTAAGRAIYDDLAPRAAAFSRQLTEVLTPSDREVFHRALKRITDGCAQIVAQAIAQDGRIEEP